MRIRRIILVSNYYYCGGSLVIAELCRCLRLFGYDSRILFCPQHIQRKLSETELRRFKRNTLFFQIRVLIKKCICKTLPFQSIRRRFDFSYFNASYLKGCKVQISPYFCSRHDVVIYPDIVYGNPLQATNVVRWLLYHYAYINDTDAYSKNDLFVGYREVFNDLSLNPADHIVTINAFDSTLYRRTNFGQRSGKCYIIRKGITRNDLPTEFDGPIIDSLPEEEKVQVFNSCEYCYSYDTQTFYSSIASICGCKSIVILEEGKKKEDYFKDEGLPPGVALGESVEELKRAERTIQALIESLDYDDVNTQNTKKLIDIIENQFGNR